jgi:hypothetical protein
MPANVIQNGRNVGTNTAINVNATDNTATKTAASESSEPNGRQRIGANRHQRARGRVAHEVAHAVSLLDLGMVRVLSPPSRLTLTFALALVIVRDLHRYLYTPKLRKRHVLLLGTP